MSHESGEDVPVTTGLLILSGMLYAAATWTMIKNQVSWGDSLEFWGAASRELLWKGEVWRVFVTAFHHGGLLHLMFNAAAIWQMGQILEPRLGSRRFFFLTLVSLIFSSLCQLLDAPYVGLSGVAYAYFGAILVLRRNDPVVGSFVGPDWELVGWFCLFAGVLVSYFEYLPIGNVAHFAGLFYGFIHAQAQFGVWKGYLSRIVFWGGHLLLLPLTLAVVAPFWDAAYHIDLGNRAKDMDQRLEHFQEAVRWDPERAIVWATIAEIYHQKNELLPAFEAISRAFHLDRAEPSFRINFPRLYWSLYFLGKVNEANAVLDEVFGEEAESIKKQFLAQAPIKPQIRLTPKKTPPAKTKSSEPLVPDRLPKREGPLVPPNPNEPDSAVEGITL